jgi:hypothetical protein
MGADPADIAAVLRAGLSPALNTVVVQHRRKVAGDHGLERGAGGFG